MKIVAGAPRLGNSRIAFWWHMKRHEIREWWRHWQFGYLPPEAGLHQVLWSGCGAMPKSERVVRVGGGLWTRTACGWEFSLDMASGATFMFDVPPIAPICYICGCAQTEEHAALPHDDYGVKAVNSR